MTQQQIEQAAIDWRGSSESAYTTDAFVAGAKWMREKLIIEAIDYLVNNGFFGCHDSYGAMGLIDALLNENKE